MRKSLYCNDNKKRKGQHKNPKEIEEKNTQKCDDG
jgi:hypothetical protein